MASNLNLVFLNFKWRIENISPTDTIPGKDFFWYEPLTLDPDQSSGMTRGFTVFWEGSDEDLEPTDMSERIATHTFTVEVAYSTDYQNEALTQIIGKDRHDLNNILRDPSYYAGYNASNSSTDIGLYSRWRVGDTLDRGSGVTWFLRQLWRCTIKESE